MCLRSFLFATYYFLLVPCIYGFTGFSGRGEGFCRSYSGLAVGYEACVWNPALLAISPTYSFNIANVGVECNSTLRYSDYMRLVSGIHFSESDKKMFERGVELDFLGSAQAISFSYHDIGFMSGVYTHQSFTLPEAVAKLLFWGNEIDSTYSLKGIKGKSEMGIGTILSGAWSFGYNGNFILGGGLKYVYGISYMDIRDSDGYLTTTFYTSDKPQIFGEGKILTRTAKGGYGLGIDLGVLYISRNYFLSLSIINAFSKMVWDRGAKVIESSFKLSPTDLETFEPSQLNWESKKYKKPFVTSFERISNFSVGLKTSQFSITAGSGYPRIFSIGGEVLYKVLALRSGCSFEHNRLWVGFGIGLIKGPLHLDIGIRGHSSARFSGSVSISVISPK